MNDVAASWWPAVAAAAVLLGLDVAAFMADCCGGEQFRTSQALRRRSSFCPSVLAVLACVGQVNSWKFPMFESSDSWVEMLVSKLAPLRLYLVVSVVATPAPTSAATMAPT